MLLFSTASCVLQQLSNMGLLRTVTPQTVCHAGVRNGRGLFTKRPKWDSWSKAVGCFCCESQGEGAEISLPQNTDPKSTWSCKLVSAGPRLRNGS